MKKGKTKGRSQQLDFRFTIDGYPYAALEIWTKYVVTFMVGIGGRPAFFNWDGEKWLYDIKDEQLASKIIQILEQWYESKL